MAKMQSLEEDALLKGTLAIQDLGSSSSSPVKPKGSLKSENGMEGAGGSPNKGTPGGRVEDAEEPQTDGDETDDYSDQVFSAPQRRGTLK